MKRLPAVISCLALLAVRLGAAELRSVPFHRFGIASDRIGHANLVVADLTGDARPEIVSCSADSPLALGYSAGTYVPIWHGPALICIAAAVGDANGDGATDVVVVNGTISSGSSLNGGKVMIFDPRGVGAARVTVTLPGNKPPTDVAFGNVDGDAAPEIVVTTVDATFVYDARTLELQWEASGYGGTEVALGDIDGDARLEIVVNDDVFGAVLDGGAEVVKWAYAGGFGQNVTVANVDADAKAEIVFPDGPSTYTDIVMLNGDFTETRIPYNGMPVAVADADGNGTNEIITDGYFSGLKGLNPGNGSVVWTLPTPETGVFGDAAVGDVDGDGTPELVYGAGTSSYRDILIVANVASQTIEHESLDLDGELHSATGDLDGDGSAELVIASRSSKSNYEGGIVQIVDPRTHAIEGVLSRTGLTYFDIHGIAIGQLDDDAAREIVALGTDFYDPMLVVWDAATREIQWQSPDPGSNPSFVAAAMVVANIDGDARDEIILGMSDGNLVALNGGTSVIQASEHLNGYLAALALADIDGDAALEVVAGTDTTLYVLDDGDWSVMEETPLANIKNVAATGHGGGKIAVSFAEGSYSGKVRLYDVELTTFWTCTLTTDYDYFSEWPLVFARAGDETRLIGGTGAGKLMVFPIEGGTSCPASSTIAYSSQGIADLHSVEVTGDDRPELVVDTRNAVEVDLLGLTTESRGDADGDGGIDGQDVDAIVEILFGAAPGILPTADVNADERISPEDAFALIHYEYGGGPEPQP